MLDSRGNPTVEVDVELDGGAAAVPAFQAEQVPGNTKLGNCATVTKTSISAKVY